MAENGNTPQATVTISVDMLTGMVTELKSLAEKREANKGTIGEWQTEARNTVLKSAEGKKLHQEIQNLTDAFENKVREQMRKDHGVEHVVSSEVLRDREKEIRDKARSLQSVLVSLGFEDAAKVEIPKGSSGGRPPGSKNRNGDSAPVTVTVDTETVTAAAE